MLSSGTLLKELMHGSPQCNLGGLQLLSEEGNPQRWSVVQQRWLLWVRAGMDMRPPIWSSTNGS